MIDVHPPHEGIHTWKDYLLHMSTIVLGLLLAIGLEQSVEALHRAHERQELRASLEWDTEKAVEDASQAEKTEKEPLLWLEGREQQIQDALKTHRPPQRHCRGHRTRHRLCPLIRHGRRPDQADCSLC